MFPSAPMPLHYKELTTDNNQYMTLAVRFRFYGATVPTFDIVELDNDQWRSFFWLEHSAMRMEWMIHFMNLDFMRHEIKELWWIPLDDQSGLQIAPDVKVIQRKIEQ